MENKNHMTMQAHLAEIERRHHAIEKEIAEAFKRKSFDDLELVELKRQKLHLKDEIERLRHDQKLWGHKSCQRIAQPAAALKLSSAGHRDAEELTFYGLAYLRILHEGPYPRYTGC
jgi:hypothetical protein